jgi:hypothetical protein
VYLFFALILVLLGLWISPGHNITDVPFSGLTLRMVFGSLLEMGAYLSALFLFFKSLEHDHIWPWRWTWPYFGNLVIKGLLIALIMYGVFWLIERKKVDGFWFIVAVIFAFIGVLYIIFSSEVEAFSITRQESLEGWPEAKQYQNLRIRVKQWDYKLFIKNIQPSQDRRSFQFKGFIGGLLSKVLYGRSVLGEFEIKYEPLHFDEDESVSCCGELRWITGGPQPFLGLSLYTNPAQYEELFRIFSTISGITAGNVLSLDLTLTHPKWNVEGFWQTGWHDEGLLVVRYDIHSGGYFKSKDSLPWISRLLC